MTRTLPSFVDVAIVGGGVAGLWILDRLRRKGMTAMLIERGPFGEGQTLYSQGILHRGGKYLLRQSQQTAFPDLFPRWAACLEGRGPENGEPDLRTVEVLSESPWLLSRSPLPPSLEERLQGARERGLASPAESTSAPSRTSTSAPPPAEWTAGSTSSSLSPLLVGEAPANARWKLHEPVLDMRSLLAALARPHSEHCWVVTDPRFGVDSTSSEAPVSLTVGGKVVVARRLVLAAGEGNEAILRTLGRTEPSMIKRPLKMVCIDGRDLPPVWAHVLDQDVAPGREGAHFTVTSHARGSFSFLPPSAGPWWWYVGGDFSEKNLPWSLEESRSFLQPLLRRTFPGVDWPATRWHLMLVNRAEPMPLDGHRRLEPFVHLEGPVLTAWPLKLVLTPLLVDRVVEALVADAR